MKQLVCLFSLAVLLISCLLLGSCGDNSRATALLSRADSLMADRPDSALQILDGCEAEVAAWPESQQMRHRLLQAKARNKAYVPFTSDSVMTIVVEYYDHHGTANEQMEAHYLLGCVYRDLGEAPKALSAYHDAVECADTTAADCDYKTLCRVYAQMSDVYYYQTLYEDQLASLDRATYFGYLAKDTLAALLTYAQKMDTYEKMFKSDSMLIVCETVSRLFLDAGYMSKAADVLGLPIRYLCDQDSLIKAKRFLDIYERESGFFDENHNIEHGREVYYYTKGYYYLKTCQYDSAEYYFRKELATGKDFNNQNAGARGLALLFQQTHKPDSAAKYALYSYAMNDSVYAHKATNEVAKTKALYDYTRYEKEAQQSKLHAISAQLRFVITALIAVLILSIAMILAYRYRNLQKKRREEKLRYQQLKDSYRRTEKELSELRTHQEEFSRMIVERQEALAYQQHTTQELNRLRQSEQMLTELISEKEQELAKLDAELDHYRRKDELMAVASSDEECRLREYPFYQSLLHTTDQGHALTDSDWKSIHKFLKEHLPDFYRFATDNHHALTDYEYQMCLLVRLYLKPKNIANALDLDGSYVTRTRRSMVKKLFGVDANSKEADVLIRQIDRLKVADTTD